MLYQYPLDLSFKLISWGPQVFVRDATGREVLYVHMKALKLREDVSIFSDSSKTYQLYQIRADRVIDFSARYDFTDVSHGMSIGSIKREGMRSIWKASYNIFDPTGQPTHHVKEDNPWVKVGDALLREIPIVGMFTGYFLNPTFTLYQVGTENPVLRLKKKASFFEQAFEIVKLGEPTNEAEETRLVLALMMMVLLERARG